MMNDNEMKRRVVELLRSEEPEMIVLFGSRAENRTTPESDIDLYVVTADDHMPKNWEERSRLHLSYIRKLDPIQKEIPIDLIVHTRKMHQRFKALNSQFFRDIAEKGEILWQKS